LISESLKRQHEIPLSVKTDSQEVIKTVEDHEVWLEILTEAIGKKLQDVWPIISERKEKKKTAYYRIQSDMDAYRRDLTEKDRTWLVEFGAHPLEGAFGIFEAGGTFEIEDFACGQCKAKLLSGENGAKYIQARFRMRNFSLEKDELFETIRKELLDPRSITYLICHGCGNVTATFRLIEKPK